MASEHHASINHEYLFAGIVMAQNRIICIKMCVTAFVVYIVNIKTVAACNINTFNTGKKRTINT